MNSSLKILIAEDDEATREALVLLLKRRGHNILEASQGLEAVDIIEKEKPDMVFLDIKLADDMDGMQVLKESKRVSPQTEVVMMSAYQAEHGQQSKELGAYSFLKKPIVKLEQFTNLIEEIRKKKNMV